MALCCQSITETERLGRLREQLWAEQEQGKRSALREIKTVVQTVLEDLAASGEEIPQPFSKGYIVTNTSN
jgi:hypothetical protein